VRRDRVAGSGGAHKRRRRGAQPAGARDRLLAAHGRGPARPLYPVYDYCPENTLGRSPAVK
jgi:hypothetical protein